MKLLSVRAGSTRRSKAGPTTTAKHGATPRPTSVGGPGRRGRERWLVELLGLALTGLVVVAIALASLAEVAKTAVVPAAQSTSGAAVGRDGDLDTSASPLRDERLCCRETR